MLRRPAARLRVSLQFEELIIDNLFCGAHASVDGSAHLILLCRWRHAKAMHWNPARFVLRRCHWRPTPNSKRTARAAPRDHWREPPDAPSAERRARWSVLRRGKPPPPLTDS